ncbi:MAG: rhomboid family intramembrane serine protease [Streptosporangiaceae bacterium]|nr:rhomboid family intramembrane serine protease [Streptosporangiaceae bacterium]
MASQTGPGTSRRAAEIDVDEARKAFFLMVGFIALIWVLQVANWADSYRLDTDYGILSRSVSRLPDIFIAPFLHFGWDHIEGNSGPLFVFGLLAAYRGVVRFLGVTLVVIITSGMAAWLFESNGTVTVGASGLIFGYFGYVLARGLIDRNLIDALIAIVMGLSYYYLVTIAVPGAPAGISWKGHLGGLVGGLAAGWIFRTRRGRAFRQARTAVEPGATGTATTAVATTGTATTGARTTGTATMPVPKGHPRADLYKELDDMGL